MGKSSNRDLIAYENENKQTKITTDNNKQTNKQTNKQECPQVKHVYFIGGEATNEINIFSSRDEMNVKQDMSQSRVKRTHL